MDPKRGDLQQERSLPRRRLDSITLSEALTATLKSSMLSPSMIQGAQGQGTNRQQQCLHMPVAGGT